MIDRAHLRKTPLLAWFIAFGLLDLAVALVLAYGFHSQSSIILVLLPSLVLWGDNPASPAGLDAVIAGLFVFGLPFVLYGLLGVLCGLIVRLGRRSPSPS